MLLGTLVLDGRYMVFPRCGAVGKGTSWIAGRYPTTEG